MTAKPVLCFWVKDKETGKEAELYEIVLKSYKEGSWAKDLIYCDLEGWGIEDDGTLIVCDECGSFAYPPQERFEIVWNHRPRPVAGDWEKAFKIEFPTHKSPHGFERFTHFPDPEKFRAFIRRYAILGEVRG